MAALFLSYRSEDGESVRAVQKLLHARGIETFLDRDHLRAGQPWPLALEEALRSCRAVAVFVGEELGAWQRREMWFALDRQAVEEKSGARFPVIPILLPKADTGFAFLFLNTWVDLRERVDDPDAIERIARALESPAGSRPRAEADGNICPFRGLDPFGEEHAAFFCGRDAVVDELYGKVVSSQLVTLVGSSGCGKSSVVRAGLVPRLRRQRPPNVTWDLASFTPGRDPYRRLARELVDWLEPECRPADLAMRSEELGRKFVSGESTVGAFIEEGLRASGADRLLLVVDQFEELFTHAGPDLRKPFVASLLRLLRETPVTVVITLRADFYGLAIDLHRELSDLMQSSIVNVGRLRRAELREAIEKPAHLVGLEFESPLLVEKLLDDVGNEPGNLPLLQYALLELWRGRRAGRLLRETYDGIQGVAGAIAARAENELARLGPDERERARRLMTRLVHTSPTSFGLENTRHRASLSDLGDDARAIVTAFSQPGVRLLVTGRDETGHETVEVAHEALIGAWKRLREWLAQDVELRLWRQRLEPSIEWWARDRTNALQGLALAEAEKWFRERGADLVPREAEFIRASVEQRDRAAEAQAAQRARGLEMAQRLADEAEARRRSEAARADQAVRSARVQRRWTFTAVAVACVIAVLAAFAIRAMRLARSRELASAALASLRTDPELSLALAREGLAIADTMEAASALRDSAVTLRGTHVRAILRRPPGRAVRGASFSSDGSRVVTASEDGGVRVWETRSGRLVSEISTGSGIVYSAMFGRSSDRILTASGDGVARVWSASSGECLARLERHADKVRTAVFSDDGRRILTASGDGTARLWDADTGREVSVVARHDRPIRSAAFGPGSVAIVTASEDGTARVWEAASGNPYGEPLKHGTRPVNAAVFSPDGGRVATASDDHAVRMWNWRSGKCLNVFLHPDRVRSVAFNPDGTRIVTAAADKVVRIWSAQSAGPEDGCADVQRQKPLLELRGHEGEVHAAAFDARGAFVVTAAADGTARIWEVDPPRELAEVEGHGSSIRHVAFDRDGDQIVTASEDGTARIWTATGGVVATLGAAAPPASDPGHAAQLVSSPPPSSPAIQPHRGWVTSAEFTPDGRHVVTAGADGRVLLWDARGGAPVAEIARERAWIYRVALSPDGDRIVTAAGDGVARVWDRTSGAVVAALRGHRGRVTSALFSSDGERVLTAGEDRTARVWDLRSQRTLVTLAGHEGWVHRAAFSQDGTLVVTASGDQTACVWNARTGSRIARLAGHTGAVLDAAFSPDGRYVVTVSEDKTARIWVARTGARVSEIRRHTAWVFGAAYSADGQRLATTGGDKVVNVYAPVWHCGREALEQLVRPLAAREFTDDERRMYGL